MKPLALDTPLHVEQRWIAGLRAQRSAVALAAPGQHDAFLLARRL